MRKPPLPISGPSNNLRELFHQQSPRLFYLLKRKFRLLDGLSIALFHFSLMLTLFHGSMLWLARIGWTLLAILCTPNLSYAVYAIYFFAAFFHSTGFLPHLSFSLKHFHMAVFLAALIQLTRGSLFKTFRTGFSKSKSFVPLLIIMSIALGTAAVQGTFFKAFRPMANFGLILVSLVFFLGMVGEDERLLKRGLGFFVAGVALQILIAFYNRITAQDILSIQIRHNNHLAVIASLAFFHGVGGIAAARSGVERFFFRSLTFIIFLGLVFSCSRTGWLSLIFGYSLLRLLIPVFCANRKVKMTSLRSLCLSGVICLSVVILFMITSKEISERVVHLPELLDPKAWRYALNDTQNFGFLGIFRLEQLYELGIILRSHFFFGISFIHRNMEFHGLYFVVLGATGIMGLLCFAFFIRNLLHDLLRSIQDFRQPRDRIFRICLLCSVVVWLLASFVETLFLQFAVWINVASAIAVIQLRRFPARTSEIQSRYTSTP